MRGECSVASGRASGARISTTVSGTKGWGWLVHSRGAITAGGAQATTYIAAVHAGSAPFDHELGAGIGPDGLEEDGADSTAGEQLVDVAKEREDGVVQEREREMVEVGRLGSLRWNRCSSRGGAAPPRGGQCGYGHGGCFC